MLEFTAELDYEVFMLDFQTTFLMADAEEHVFVDIDPCYNLTDTYGVPLVIVLNKSLCGLRQSLNNWFGPMDHHLAKIGSRPLKSDPCMYVFEDHTGFLTISLRMNDFFLILRRMEEIKLKLTTLPRIVIHVVRQFHSTAFAYVNLLPGANKQLLNNLKKQFLGHFQMSDIGDTSRAPGMNVNRDHAKGTAIIDQKYYSEDTIKHFGTKNCNPVFTTGAEQ